MTRPPWTTENAVRQNCTSCGKCIQNCPQGILVTGPAGTPVVDFRKGECTFCETCAQVCPEGVFETTDTAPWNLQAAVGEGCLLASGISCQICTDHCDAEVLKLDLSHRPVGRIAVDVAACTGCGACVAACPQEAINIRTVSDDA